ncbi:retinaldehyde-binding protein 1-like [Toxorhynchites rutilus septentrionalis]|uniref:retinaldehyde-binding protein 1-like n=1 Tax=Toxorhynchites rutilus septentrionalis TaxID=329112 RepID=UPI00247852C7|nr:retinaldehyde-binding protein 1-like [Toxorhynchites rutilus septentrionalis]
MTGLSVEKFPEQYDEYTFTLGERYLKMAQEDLNETDSVREQSLTQMREWIAKHPFIKKCRTDSVFVLRFLRLRKFSVPRAQETLERYLAMRQSFPQWFQKLDPEDVEMKELLGNNQYQILGKDSEGRTVILIELKRFNEERFTSDHQARNAMLLLELLFDDEETQIGGYVVVLDYMDLTMRQLAIWSLTDVKNFMNCVNHSLPFRLREVHAVRLPKFALAIAELAVSCLSQKLKDRIFCHKSMGDVRKHLDDSLLTLDYEGGKQDPEQLKNDFIRRAVEKRQELLLLDEMEIDASRYKSLWHQTTDESIESGVAGSFRKLTVD